MNQQIKSHWKLAFRSVVTALKVTFSIPFRVYKAHMYQLMVSGKLDKQRELFSMIPSNKFITIDRSND